MTLDEFKDRWRAEFMGLITDGLMSGMRGADTWKRLELIAKQMDGRFAEMHAALAASIKVLPVPPDVRESTLRMLRDAKGTLALEAAWKAITLDQKRAAKEDLPELKEAAAKYDTNPH